MSSRRGSVLCVIHKPMKKVLLSGFGPFLDIKDNPSEVIVRSLAQSMNVPHIILPVVFGQAFDHLKALCQEQNPDIVLMFGVAATRSKICFERIGLNWVESKNPDTSMRIPPTGKINLEQELALMSSLDLEKIISQYNLSERQHVEISYSAGAYVCNDLYFRMLNEKSIEAEKLFIHVPSFDCMDQSLQIELIKTLVLNCLGRNENPS